ncbi:transglutaminase [Bacteroidales bacterium]|nr:transglutaminase [Bacteroidales bacterium]
MTAFLTSCAKEDANKRHFISDSTYRQKVETDYKERMALYGNKETGILGIESSENLSTEELEALQFLYAYMPLSDLIDYNTEYFIAQVRSAFTARDHFSWGESIPEDIFRHFVLVHRVNNENLDTARQVFFEELKPLLEGLSMREAALKVNHWCHEKVIYRATDGRTSSPLALVRTSWGRCGEESTFTTAALRAVGIPSRQCYTPRWVHTDSNHAWVEVWIDGKWHFIGACEPEPELDFAWFTAPARRAMMVNTTVIGPYNGEEAKLSQTDLYTRLNLLKNYADTRTLEVTVNDIDGKPVKDATIQFKVYNYGNLFPIAEGKTDTNGTFSIETGFGDILVWANKDDKYAYGKAAADNNKIEIKLNRREGESYKESFVMNPPKEQKVAALSQEQIASNDILLVQEDSIRNIYMSSFPKEEKAKAMSTDNWQYLLLAQGNWEEIKKFIDQSPQGMANPFLASLSEKDLRDTPAQYLLDAIDTSRENDFCSKFKMNAPPKGGKYDETLTKYILSPRIGIELIRPGWDVLAKQVRELIKNQDEQDLSESQITNLIKTYVESIQVSEENYYRCPVSPVGVMKLGYADAYSRDIFFVALCRSVGLPARLNPVTNKAEYKINPYSKDELWQAVYFGYDKQPEQATASISLTNASSNRLKPIYASHYALAKFDNGDFVNQDYRSQLKKLPAKVDLISGYYRLLIASRADDGSVSIDCEFFSVGDGDKLTKEIKLPETEGKKQVLGTLDMNTGLILDNRATTLKQVADGKSIVICFIDPDKEPSKHVLQDLPAQASELDLWGGKILFMVPSSKQNKNFDPSVFKGLPSNHTWAIDPDQELLITICKSLDSNFDMQTVINFPLTVVATSNGGIVMKAEGYRIGIGENILKNIDR